MYEIIITWNIASFAQNEFNNINTCLKGYLSSLRVESKLKYLEAIGTDRTVAIGNGANDVKMLKAAAIGIAVIGPEGCSTPAILSSDVVTGSITDALDILAHSHRIKATMRR